MKRAAILIGVSNADGLSKLHAVSDGVKRMQEWAIGQGIKPSRVKSITDDDGGMVSSSDIELAVVDALENDSLEQLIIYFAGHGVIVNYNEYWLLSKSLQLASQSVNVRASIDRARYCGTKHVVLISDACRTAPKTVQGQGTMGTVIFPNPKAGANKTHVDIFYATRLGAPSAEINNQDAADGYRAVYTDSLLNALNGKDKNICEPDENLGIKVVRPWPLSTFLDDDVPLRYLKLSGSLTKTQEPEAIITSPPMTSWIADVSNAKPPVAEKTFQASPDEIVTIQNARSETKTTDRMLQGLIQRSDNLQWDRVLEIVRDQAAELQETARKNEFAETTAENLEAFGPAEFESRCGFKIRGAKLAEVVCRTDNQIHDNQEAVGIFATKPVSTLLVFESGYGALLPALPHFIGSLTLTRNPENEMPVVLSDVYFEPSRGTRRHDKFEAHADRIRGLRAVIATSAQRGTFRLREENAATMSRKMQLGKSIDPSLALYAAHGYANLGDRGHLQEMAHFLRNDLGRIPLDVALLAGEMGVEEGMDSKLFTPFLPMLSQTWGVVPAYNVAFPKGLEEIDRHLVVGSLWSLYMPQGVELIRKAMKNGELN